MATVIWTKTATYGTVEVTAREIMVNGVAVANMTTGARKLPKAIVKDGKTFTHVIGDKIALTSEEAVSYVAAVDAYFAALPRLTIVPNAAARAEALTRKMDREHSAL